MPSTKENLNDLLKTHEELQAAKREVERCEEELIRITETQMKLLLKQTRKYIHEGQLVIVTVHDFRHKVPSIHLPEVENTDYEEPAILASIEAELSDSPAPPVPLRSDIPF